VDFRHQVLVQKRIGVLQAVAWTLVLLLLATYAWMQLIRRGAMQEAALQNSVKTRITQAPRGIIYDRNGDKLVDNSQALHLVIQHEDLPSDPSQITALAQALELDPAALSRRIHNVRVAAGNRMLVLQDNLDDAGLAQAEMLRARYPFLTIEVAPRRVYLGNDLAGHVLGYVGEVSPDLLQKMPGKYQSGEIIGVSGFESARNDRLKGKDGQRQILVDNLGREVALFGLQEPHLGRSVYLTLDAGLQQVLKEAFGEEQGAGVVIDLRDGGILAMYSSPSFDPNIFLNRLTQEDVEHFIRNPSKPLINRVTQGLYPPGSTFKLVVTLAALEKGLITPATSFTCYGKKTFYNREFRCDAVHGTVNLTQAIAHSCNNYFWEVGSRLDIDEIHATAVKYGITELTGVDLPQEKASRVPSRAWKAQIGKTPEQQKWYAGETLSVAIGQGANGLTPISLARFYAMLATKGKLLTPHLYYGLRSEATGQMEVFQPPPPRETGLDPRIWSIVDEGLAQVVKVGTAKGRFNIPGLEVAGKTGTSQLRAFVSREESRKQEKKFRDNALFAGYAPRNNPQIAFAVVAENAGFGGSAAAPIAAKLCQYWFVERPANPRKPPTGRVLNAFRLEARKTETPEEK
jgi:penicillin-binding protein 2